VVAVAATVEAGVTYADQKAKAEKVVAENRAALKAMDDATLARVKANTSVVSSAASFIFGTPTQSDELKTEKAHRQFAPLAGDAGALKDDKSFQKDALDAFGLGNIGIDKVIKQAEGGNKDALAAIKAAIDKARSDPGKASHLDSVKAQAEAAAASASDLDKTKAGPSGEASQLSNELDATKAAYQAGTASFAEYIQSRKNALETIKHAVDAAGPGGGGNLALLKQSDTIQLEVNKALSTQARALADEQIALSTEGGAAGPQATVAELTALLSSGKLTDPADQVKAAKDIVTAQHAVLNEQANMAQTAKEKLAILRAGVAVAEPVRVEELYNVLNNLDFTWQQFFNSITSSMAGAAHLAQEVARRAVQDGIDSVEALRRTLQDTVDRFAKESAGDFSSSQDGGRVSIVSAANAQKGLSELPAAGLKAYQPPTSTVNANEDQLAAAQKGADSEAKAAEDKARAEAQKAAEEVRAQTKARLALRKAQAEGDPVAQAQVGIEEAQNLVQEATKESERISAEAQLVSAQRQLLLAQQSVADAYRNIDKALAAAAGDTVRVAELEIAAAREHLDNARGRGDQMAALQAEAQLIAAQASSVSAQLSTSQRNTDFLLTMQKITTGQAIAQLEALLKIPGITQEQTQQLLLKINQLRKDASKDLAFNIPSDIKLPTIYEVRRSIGSGGGNSYNDRRQININVNASNAGDVQTIANTLADQFASPSRYGTTPKRY